MSEKEEEHDMHMYRCDDMHTAALRFSNVSSTILSNEISFI